MAQYDAVLEGGRRPSHRPVSEVYPLALMKSARFVRDQANGFYRAPGLNRISKRRSDLSCHHVNFYRSQPVNGMTSLLSWTL